MIRPAPSDPVEIEATLWADWKGKRAWDIGANCGQSVRHIARVFDRVYAFEPNQSSFEFVLKIVREYYQEQVTAFKMAVSDHDGSVKLAAIPRLMETGQLVTPGTHGMEWDPAEGWDRIPHVEVTSVTADTLTDSLGVPDFIKVDTEGHEGRILKGAGEILEFGKTDWLIEFHTPELHDSCLGVLDKHNYQLETVRHPHYPPLTPMYYQHGWIRAKAPRGRNANG